MALTVAQARVEAARAALAEAEAELEARSTRPVDVQLALDLHDQVSHRCDMEYCGWGWEGLDWSGSAHQRWLRAARELLELTDADTALRVAPVVRRLL